MSGNFLHIHFDHENHECDLPGKPLIDPDATLVYPRSHVRTYTHPVNSIWCCDECKQLWIIEHRNVWTPINKIPAHIAVLMQYQNDPKKTSNRTPRKRWFW